MPDKILTDAAIGSVVDTAITDAILADQPLAGEEDPVIGTVCSNCHTLLKGRHCHHCGQVADTYHRPVWSLFAEILEGYLGLDGRIWRTVPPLLFSPGKITAQYLKGVRQPYMSPFRLFLLSSLLFFLTFAVLVSNNEVFSKAKHKVIGGQDISDMQAALAQAKQELQASTESATAKARDNKRIAFIEGELDRKVREKSSTPSPYGTAQRMVCALRAEVLPKDPLSETCAAIQAEARAQVQGEADALEEGGEKAAPGNTLYVDAPALTGLSVETKRFIVNNIETAVNNPGQYLAAISRWAPRLAFVLAPIYGLFLAMCFFWRRDAYLYDHMVVALHFHAFLFLFLVALVPIGLWMGFGAVALTFLVWSNYYLYQLLRRVYGLGPAGALVRLIILENLYFIALSIAFLGLLVLGVVFV